MLESSEDERLSSDEDIDVDYVPDLSMLEPLPFDDQTIARQFEAGLDTMDSWQDYTSSIEERKEELQNALELTVVEEENDRKLKKQLAHEKKQARRKRREQPKLAANPVLNSIQDDSASEAQSSSDDLGDLSDSSSIINEDLGDGLGSGVPSDNEASLLSTDFVYETDAALDAEIEAEEKHLRQEQASYLYLGS
jgi:hypothetical protein